QKFIHLLIAPRPPGPFKVSSGSGSRNSRRDFTLSSWENYYDDCRDLKIDDDIFRVYLSGSSGPVCFFLHGGGFSALSWAVLSVNLLESVTCRCVAMDFRGHGDTHTSNEADLSADVMANDVGRVVYALYGEDIPPIVLIGHSMGGAIAVHVAYKQTVSYLVGLIVIDVVEGTAMEALSGMQTFLRNRPSTFDSIESAVEYCCKTGQIRNIESAKVSVIGQLKSSEVIIHKSDVIAEEEEEDEDVMSRRPQKHRHHLDDDAKYCWRIDLTTTEPYWKGGWFEGLSTMFLACKPPKMLLLAGVDRLDKDLTIGQMQGCKFQLELLPQCGHAVHEDCPDKVAERLSSFLIRYKLAQPTSTNHSKIR
ncbi:hypothetical protein HELRODRAFT_75640, partial [Helobdella robusta]|uniref:Protein phosphatase methylesterase 1 n=1 Tax=Helobdella robusta TaxID=6412 RepID=T1G281_HELRO